MEYNKRSGSNHESRREYGSSDSRPYRSFNGERRQGNRNNDNRSQYGERRPRRNYGERPAYSSDRPVFSTDRPSYGERHSYGERNSYGERPGYGERPSYGERSSYGERPSYGEQRPRRNGGLRPRRNNPGTSEASFNRRGEGRTEFRSTEFRNTEFRSAEGRPSKPGFKKKPSKFAQQGQGRGQQQRRYNKPMFRNEDESGISRMIDRRKAVENERLSDNDQVVFPIKEEVRLNKFIANSGICSRREADNFILAGCVTVNGSVVTELGSKVNVNNDDVRFNGERLHGETKVYIVMNKPKGFVTTTSDPHAEKTVMELLKKCPSRVFPVGRLDKNTTGVLMFTNDGEIAERLTHPSYDKKKIYQVSLDRDLSQEDYDKILAGVELSDGEVSADALDYIEDNDKRKIGIEIHSGKNRIVRRIFESLGYDVKALDRVYFAGLTKKGLKRGEWRYLTEGEVNILKMGAYI